MAGFIAVYRWRVSAENEDAFRRKWREITMLGRQHGAHGSALSREANGELVAIALWPSEAARGAAFEAMGDLGAWPPAERISEARLTLLDDLWAVSPFRSGD